MFHKANDETNALKNRISVLYNHFYNLCFFVGLATASAFKIIKKSIIVMLGFTFFCVKKFFTKTIPVIISKLVMLSILVEIKKAISGYKSILLECRSVFKEKGFPYSIKHHFGLLSKALKNNKRSARIILNHVAPVLAVVALVLTLNMWTGVTFALAVEYDGNNIGYVTDEAVFIEASEMVASQIVSDKALSYIEKPNFKLSMVKSDKLSDTASISKSIIENTSELCEANGVYYSNKLISICYNADEINTSLNNYLNLYKTQAENERVEYAEKLQVVSGLYPVSEVSSIDDFRDNYLKVNTDTALEVKVVKDIVYQEEIPFDSVEKKDDAKLKDYRKITQAGSNGVANVTAEVMLVNGYEVDRAVKSSEIITPPVNEQVVVGTATKIAAQSQKSFTVPSGDGVSTGDFAWPVKRVARSYVSSYFGDNRGHKGIDIAAARGTDIYVADGGTVVSMNSIDGSYGLHFIIDHGNGVKTLYSHCSVINVKLGQKVTKGQKIAEVGRTGNATGNHLHFEVIVNGRNMNPMIFFN